MKYYKILLMTILMMVISVIGYTQQRDSLMNYLEIAAKNNPTVRQKFTEYKAALQKVPQAGSLSDPQLDLGVFLTPMELMGGNQVAEIQLMQMFPWFGTLKNAKDEMSLMAQARYESFRDAKLQVFFDLQQTWYELYKIRQSIRSSEKNLSILRTLERLSFVRFKAASSASGTVLPSGNSIPSNASQGASAGGGMQGMGGSSATNTPKSPATSYSSMTGSAMASSGSSGLADIYRIQMEIAELENNISLLDNQQNTIAARFNSYLNRPVQLPVALPDTLLADSLNIPLETVSDSMLANNPMLTMLNLEQQSLEERKEMVKRMGYPMIGLGLNYSLIDKAPMSTSEMNGRDMVMPMMTVTLPIYRKKYKAMQEEAELMKTATSQGMEATANALESEYYEALQNYQDARRRITLYTQQNQLANQSLNILMKSFSSSGAGLTDLLGIRRQTLDYELRKVGAVADFNTAVAKLNRLMAYSQIQ
ncbi:MAG TPA: TolC family protein [Prolixibacteraceae bacterium]|nr:TolC family protein [Prolixibacteraceae bacterium]